MLKCIVLVIGIIGCAAVWWWNRRKVTRFATLPPNTEKPPEETGELWEDNNPVQAKKLRLGCGIWLVIVFFMLVGVTLFETPAIAGAFSPSQTPSLTQTQTQTATETPTQTPEPTQTMPATMALDFLPNMRDNTPTGTLPTKSAQTTANPGGGGSAPVQVIYRTVVVTQIITRVITTTPQATPTPHFIIFTPTEQPTQTPWFIVVTATYEPTFTPTQTATETPTETPTSTLEVTP